MKASREPRSQACNGRWENEGGRWNSFVEMVAKTHDVVTDEQFRFSWLFSLSKECKREEPKAKEKTSWGTVWWCPKRWVLVSKHSLSHIYERCTSASQVVVQWLNFYSSVTFKFLTLSNLESWVFSNVVSFFFVFKFPEQQQLALLKTEAQKVPYLLLLLRFEGKNPWARST